MENIERQVRRKARTMTRREEITKAIAKQLNWIQAAEIIGVKPRQMRRIRWRVEHYGLDAGDRATSRFCLKRSSGTNKRAGKGQHA